MEYDDDDYLDSLRGGRSRLPLRGNPPGDSNLDLNEGQVGGGPRAFAATAPDFVSDLVSSRTRTRTNRTGDTQASRIDTASPRLRYWKNNHVVTEMKDWGSLKGAFPVLAPITEIIKIKHSICL